MNVFSETGRASGAGPLSYGLETKDLAFDQVATVADDGRIEGYASLFGKSDQSGDMVERGAFARSLAALKGAGRSEAAIAHSRALRSSRSAYSGFMYSECPA